MTDTERQTRRAFCVGLAGATAITAGGWPAGARAQSANFPERPVRIVVGYAPGGPLDSVSRALVPSLTQDLGKSVFVENRPGGSGVIAGEIVARAKPDGYDLILNGITHALLPALRNDLPFDTARDFTAVGLVGYGGLMLVVPAESPARTAAEFLAMAKREKGKLSYGSPGNGTSPHVAFEMFKRTTGIDIAHVAYKGSAQAQVDLVANRIQAMMDVVTTALPLVQSGRLRALAVTGPKRLASLPDVPTMIELGYPESDFVTWWGIFGPAGMPAAVTQRLNSSINRALDQPDVQARIAALGGQVSKNSPEGFDRIVRSDLARFGAVIREAGIRVD